MKHLSHAEFSRRGGQSKSPAKIAAVRKSAEKARAALAEKRKNIFAQFPLGQPLARDSKNK